MAEPKIPDSSTSSATPRSCVDATDWVDYLEEIKWNGRRVIVNVVWENKPKTR